MTGSAAPPLDEREEMTLPAELLDRFKTIVGPKGWIDDPAAMKPYVTERRDLYEGRAALIVRPSSVSEVSAVMKCAFEKGVAVVPQGGNTGLVGGGVPFAGGQEIVLSLSRLNKIREIDPLNDSITVDAGVVLSDIQQAAESVDRLFPLRIASEGSCQIGGNLSTNAGGTSVLQYGNTRDLALGLEVVLADGEIWNGLRALRKDNTGYDLKQLFIGAEGTLGIITGALLKLYPRPCDRQVAIVGLRDLPAAIEFLALAKANSSHQLSAFELLPRLGLDYVCRHIPQTEEPLSERCEWNVLLEISGGRSPDDLRPVIEAVLEAAYMKGLLRDGVIAVNAKQAAAFWRLRESFSDAQKPEGGSIKHDISVPVSKIPAFIERASVAIQNLIPGVRIIAFGHIGDGNVHFNPSQPIGADKKWFLDQWESVSRLVHDIAVDLGGSISAEHGLGRMKRLEILRYKSPVEMDLMRRLKSVLDPKNILNPGKVL